MTRMSVRDRIYSAINARVRPIMMKEIHAGRSRNINDPTRKDSFKMAICRKVYHLNYVLFATRKDDEE